VQRNHPEVAYRSCSECRTYQYNEKDGKRAEYPPNSGRFSPRIGPVPCETAKGCPKGHYNHPKELSERNRTFIQRYYEWKAVGVFPDDAIVRALSGYIYRVDVQSNGII